MLLFILTIEARLFLRLLYLILYRGIDSGGGEGRFGIAVCWLSNGADMLSTSYDL